MMKSNRSSKLKIAAELIKHFNEDEIRIWDVRTPSEFTHGHIDGAENVPFDELEWYVSDALGSDKPIVTCSADDPRSHLVCKKLEDINVDVIDGGNWESLNKIINQQ